MVTMLHYDALQNPVQSQNRKASLTQAQGYLHQHPYESFEEDELAVVSKFFLPPSRLQIIFLQPNSYF